jgi:hypothetical protein
MCIRLGRLNADDRPSTMDRGLPLALGLVRKANSERGVEAKEDSPAEIE